MDIDRLQDFFFWCMIVNVGIYLLVVVAWLSLRDFYTNILMKVYGLDELIIKKGVYTYTANYKLLITIFNFTPWIAILIIKQAQ
jgi:hypothetical protein